MKKVIVFYFLLLIIFLASPRVLFSQGFGGGVMAGLVGSQVAGDPSSGYHKLGFYAGVFANRQFTLKSGAQLEMYFIQKGARENPSEANGNFQYLLRINYIELPLLYVFTINKHLDLSGGLAYSYMVGKPFEEANYSSSVSGASWNRSSLTFVLGIEYQITEMLTASFRTNNSLTPIRPHVSEATRFANQGQYSDALVFGLRFNIMHQQINR